MKVEAIKTALIQGLNEEINQLARDTQAIQRQSKITGKSLVQGLVFGYLQNPDASETEIAQSVSRAGVAVTTQAVVSQMNKKEIGEFMRKVLGKVGQQVVMNDSETKNLLERFSAVNVCDSTTIDLPSELKQIWRGCGNGSTGGRASVKVQAQWDLRSGALSWISLHHGNEQDRSAPMQKDEIKANSLRLADLGYFDLGVFNNISQAQGHWITRYLSQVKLYHQEDGTELELVKYLNMHCTALSDVDVRVTIGKEARVLGRLVARRCPDALAAERRRKLNQKAKKKGQKVSQLSLALAAWNVILTNLPAATFTVEQILILARVRWQIELLFKLWKTHGKLDQSRSQKPYFILCGLYAKLIGQIVQQWLISVTCWHLPDRSIVKASLAIRAYAASFLLAIKMQAMDILQAILESLSQSLQSTCKISKRRSKLACFQLLEAANA